MAAIMLATTGMVAITAGVAATGAILAFHGDLALVSAGRLTGLDILIYTGTTALPLLILIIIIIIILTGPPTRPPPHAHVLATDPARILRRHTLAVRYRRFLPTGNLRTVTS